jgi:YesN/AraC family two-component response regulator
MRKKRILLVEDNPIVLDTLGDLLEMEDYDVVTADNGKIALDKLTEFNPDAVISDVMMPEMDGFEFLKEVRKTPKYAHLPVVLLTAKAMNENKIEGYTSGADYYITKPYNSQELLLIVKNIFEGKQRYLNYALSQPKDEEYESADSKFVREVTEAIDKNISNVGFRLEEMASELCVSPSTLQKKLKRITGKSVSQFLREYRLEVARSHIEQKSGAISEIAFKVGFKSHAYFSKSYKEYFGVTPRNRVEEL